MQRPGSGRIGRRGKISGNRFVRHPALTLGTVITVLLVGILISLELFLRSFSGLGNPLLYELNPLFGYRPQPNQVIEPKGGMGILYAARISTNNLGLRAAGVWDSNPSGKILFLGDSVTYGGQYVDDEKLFSSVVGRGLPAWQVGNGGVNAWGVENIVGLVMDSGFLPAEVVVTCLIEGDFYRGTTRASSVPLWTNRPISALQDLLMHYIWRANELRYGDSIDTVVSKESEQEKIVDRATKRLKELDEYLKLRQVRHVVIILPTRGQVVENDPLDTMVHQSLARYGIEANYLLPAIRRLESDASKRRAWYHDIVHLEPAGHAVYGDLIAKTLAAQLH